MASKVYNKEYIPGSELLNRRWSVGDEIVYNSDPEDIGNEYLHLNYGTINNIFINDKSKDMINIRLPYGKIIIPLRKITLQFIPKNKERANNKDNNNNNDLMDITNGKIERFFVYGTLRDDNDSGSIYRKEWISNCNAENGRLYKFKLFKERYEDYPFAVRTNNKNDYINGRIISWNINNNVFQQKLQIADKMEGYIDGGIDDNNLYKRDIVDVLNENGDLIKAIAYYQNVNIEDLTFYDEIPDGDWLKRDRSRDLSEYNPSAQMLVILKEMIKNAKENDELINSLPLPPEELEQEISDEMSDDEVEQKLNSWEYFRISGDNIAIINDCRTIKKFRSGIHTAYGKYIIYSNINNIYKWRFKINNGWNEGVIVIGIASKIIMNINEAFYQYDEFENYSFNILNGYKITQNMFQQYSKIKIKINDIIDMELNMKESTLSYYINNQFQGIAFDDIKKNKKISYQMAVSLQTNMDEITLQNFKIIQLQ